MGNYTPADEFLSLLSHATPHAQAWVRGSSTQSQLSGIVNFYQTSYGGTLVEAQVFGLPNIRQQSSTDFYGFHIHENGDCSNDFQNTGAHYNPTDSAHPQHAGDFPPLLGNQGYAYSVFYDKRFTAEDIIGKSVIIHSRPDDFTTQPAGNSGNKIGCGVIKKFY